MDSAPGAGFSSGAGTVSEPGKCKICRRIFLRRAFELGGERGETAAVQLGRDGTEFFKVYAWDGFWETGSIMRIGTMNEPGRCWFITGGFPGF